MNPALEAAFRLSTSLPVRTHYRPADAIKRDRLGKVISKQHAGNRKRRPSLEGIKEKCYRVRVRNQEFESVRHAAKVLHKSITTIYKMLDSGEAIPVSKHLPKGRPISMWPARNQRLPTGEREG